MCKIHIVHNDDFFHLFCNKSLFLGVQLRLCEDMVARLSPHRQGILRGYTVKKESLVSDIPAEHGKIDNLFFQCNVVLPL